MIKKWAIDTTNNMQWGESKFHNFIIHATQKEFLESQVPFFYAVQAFPRMLCKLAMEIEDSSERLLVVNNIYEEHGNNNVNKFHTQTYKEYLNALGWDQKLLNNPWVDQWNQKVLSLSYSNSEYAAYLSGVEYLYALISHDVSQYISTLDLKNEQSHYANHSVLDWEHGYELLSVGLSLTYNESLSLEMQEAFKQGQKDFMEMYNHLFVPTAGEMSIINKEKIAFYFIREDSSVEKNILNGFKKEKIDILSIASGGEHVFEYLAHDIACHIDVIDINIHQIELSQKKLSNLENGGNQEIFHENNVGKFEKIFAILRSYFNQEELRLLKQEDKNSQDKLKFIVDVLFSNNNLNIVFGEEATKYTKKSFADHFFHVFKTCLKNEEKNTLNIFEKTEIRNYQELSQKIKDNKEKHILNWSISNPKNFDSHKKYDMINISNIGDWMSFEEYSTMIKLLNNHLANNGCIIARKLLGDYSLVDLLKDNNLECDTPQDNTLFYSETVIGYKREC